MKRGSSRPSRPPSPDNGRTQLIPVLYQELRKADIAFRELVRLAQLHTGGVDRMEDNLDMFDAYGGFIYSLFEFYRGCIRTERREWSRANGRMLDQILTDEVVKLMRNRADRIARGDSESWDNHEAYYRTAVPSEFGRHFREVRNHLAHTAIERLSPRAGQVSLPQFYAQYHRYALLLFEEPYWLWMRSPADVVEWQEVGRFSAALLGR